MLRLEKQTMVSPVDRVLSFICACYPTQRCEIGKELASLWWENIIEEAFKDTQSALKQNYKRMHIDHSHL